MRYILQPPGRISQEYEFDGRPTVRQALMGAGLSPGGLSVSILKTPQRQGGSKARLDDLVEEGDIVVVTGTPDLFSALRRHPEQKDGEIFLGNTAGITPCAWRSQRLGVTAYDIHSKPLAKSNGLRPRFAEEQELFEAGVYYRP